jgi:hypothetical protein
VYKGINSNVDSYSAFFDNQKLSRTCLQEKLMELKATDVYVCGLAYDVCVGECQMAHNAKPIENRCCFCPQVPLQSTHSASATARS